MSQIKTSVKNQANRMEQVENTASETQDNVDEFDQSVKDNEKLLRKNE
jgi:septal ring factor EnvC (AmiA/AmiB activator)